MAVVLAPDLSVSKLCLGTMTFGEQNSYSESAKLLSIATQAGINFFDTAEMYPVPQRAQTHGKSEVYLGRWIRESNIARDKIVIATKVAGPSGQMTWIRGGPHSLDKNNIKAAIDTSLQRLCLDHIDLYQIHWPDRYTPMFGEVDYDPSRRIKAVPVDEQLQALSDAVDAGKIRYIGVSNETPYGLMEFCRASRGNRLPRVLSIQNAYSLLCRTFDYGLAECCHHESINLLAYSPLAMGLLTAKYLEDGGGPADARLNLYKECRYDLGKPNLLPAVKVRTFRIFFQTISFQAYVEISKNYGITPVELAIGFVLRHPLVASAVIGATKDYQLMDIVKAAAITLTDEMVEEIDAVHSRFPNPAP
ncbi:uncharacterized protein LOC9635254 isoform X2 [Selaginella moellendorffii]|uniref:uncharacterized protein LOC9635254 isoform X2 n=1 Tax=Selaginella moellendorffii TaxID=88036 RepID=UPI000D1C488C|nr:uncharacterized protein LOC9635254 isoform X2 [Selaginella moellendorffii]|eukprot:XP_024542944.1 uncharacterized protein LOC9635254 isoform X2 [Selaginella moellendorffii]